MTSASKKQQLIGLVVSDKMDKTVVVKVSSQKRHSKYKKSYTVSKKFKAHDEENQYHTGDRVIIESARPISKDKRFKVVTRITRGSTTAAAEIHADQREDQRSESARRSA